MWTARAASSCTARALVRPVLHRGHPTFSLAAFSRIPSSPPSASLGYPFFFSTDRDGRDGLNQQGQSPGQAQGAADSSQKEGVGGMMEEMRRIHQDMHRMFRVPFSKIGRDGPFDVSSFADMAWEQPRVDMVDRGEYLMVKADLPGMQKGDIKVWVEEGMLRIAAEHKEEKEEKEGSWVVQERRSGKVSRSLKLPTNVKEEGITAKFADGVLKLHVPKQKETAKKPINIE